MARDAGVSQHFRDGIIPWLERTPIGMEEVWTSRMEVAAGWHAGHGAHIAVIKCSRPFGEAVEVGCLSPIASIRREVSTIQRVEHEHNRFHIFTTIVLNHIAITEKFTDRNLKDGKPRRYSIGLPVEGELLFCLLNALCWSLICPEAFFLNEATIEV